MSDASILFKTPPNFEIGYGYHGSQDGLIKIGEITEGHELLDYSGGLYPIGKEFDIPTNFNIEITCQDIELEFLDQK